MVSFIFGGDTQETPESIKRKRAIAQALLRGSTRQPESVGEAIGQGLSGLGDALIYRQLNGDADKAEKAGKASLEADRASFYGDGATLPSPGAAAELSSTSPAADVSSNGDTFRPFIDEVKSGGLSNPYALAAVASTGRAESGWSPANAARTWDDPSESGKPGRAGGIMSWRGPRYDALAAAGDLSPQGQARFFLKENLQLIEKLQAAKSVEEAQSLMNSAWAFAGHDRPGGESARRLGYAKGYLPQFQGSGTQVASLDPSAGMPTVAGAIALQSGQPLQLPYRDPTVSAPNYRPSTPVAEALAGSAQAPQAARSPSPVAAALAGNAAPAAPLPSETQVASGAAVPRGGLVAQALAGERYYPPAPTAPGSSGPSVQQATRLLNNPYATEADRAMAMDAIERDRKTRDPVYQMQLRKGQLDLEATESGSWSKLDDGRLFNQRTGEVRNAPTAPGAAPSDLGLNPQYGTDANGNPVLLQLGKNGQVVQSKMPDGVTLAKEPIKLDAGTHFVLLDPITRQPVGQIPKENFKEASEKAAGTESGKSGIQEAAAAPQAIADADYSISLIDEMLTHPGRATATGMSSIIDPRNYIAGTDATDFNTRKRQLEGRAFLQAFNSLRGGGQITEVEGKKATEAITRLNAAQSDDAFVGALTELKGILEVGRDRFRQKAAGARSAAPAAGAVTAPAMPDVSAPGTFDPLGLR
ncbi:hypothetical protein [Aliirhizobium smilacinae]|uniref:Phage tail lysozyme domain-containing protein n=1 Tax=Aliirhizobium smilacinae TaxID=1395944 RepID=A0A5C4XTF5_9HYPH|nr:hypothetical protein [Rhizobium smilacinae]TNM66477.1 hypothetical protein FHP24_09845 [Rhizobium smilacinae]